MLLGSFGGVVLICDPFDCWNMDTLLFSNALYKLFFSTLSDGGVLLSLYARLSGSLPMELKDWLRGRGDREERGDGGVPVGELRVCKPPLEVWMADVVLVRVGTG